MKNTFSILSFKSKVYGHLHQLISRPWKRKKETENSKEKKNRDIKKYQNSEINMDKCFQVDI